MPIPNRLFCERGPHGRSSAPLELETVVTRLAEPLWLWAIVFVAAWPWFAQGIRPRVAWPSLAGFRRARSSGWVGFRYLSPALRALALACLAVALARPQTVAGTTRIAGRGLAIVVALDHSS